MRDIISQGSPEKQNLQCVCVCVNIKGIYYKELAHTILEAAEHQICNVGWQDQNPELMVQMNSEGRLLENSLLLWEAWSFCSI